MKQIICAMIVLLTFSINIFSMDRPDTQLFYVRYKYTHPELHVPLHDGKVTGLAIKQAFCAKLEKPCNPNDFVLIFAGRPLSDTREYDLSADLTYKITIIDNPTNK